MQDRGLHFGHVHLGLSRQMGGDAIIRLHMMALQGFFDGARAAIVGRHRQPPVAKLAMELAQLPGRRRRLFFRLTTLVPRPQAQTIPLGGRRHHLENTGRPGRTARPGIKPGFHFPQPDQFRRHMFTGKDRLQLGHDLRRALRPRPRSHLPNPKLLFHLEGRVRRRRQRFSRLQLGRRRGPLQFLRGLKIIHPFAQPCRVGLGLFVGVQQR